jgi:hypothetical protein
VTSAVCRVWVGVRELLPTGKSSRQCSSVSNLSVFISVHARFVKASGYCIGPVPCAGATVRPTTSAIAPTCAIRSAKSRGTID